MTWACVLAWLSTAAVFGILAMGLVVMLSSPETMLDAAHRENPELAAQGMTDAEIKTIVSVGFAVVMVWSAGAAALALLAWRRVRWAATCLAVSAGLASLLCLLSVVVGAGAAAALVPLAACAATLALLLRPESLAWFRARRAA